MRIELLAAMEQSRWPALDKRYDPNVNATDSVRLLEPVAIYMDELSYRELLAECTFSQFSNELHQGRFRGVMIYRCMAADSFRGRHLFVHAE